MELKFIEDGKVAANVNCSNRTFMELKLLGMLMLLLLLLSSNRTFMELK